MNVNDLIGPAVVAAAVSGVANSYLESEVEELKKAVSHAYVRGRFRTYTG